MTQVKTDEHDKRALQLDAEMRATPERRGNILAAELRATAERARAEGVRGEWKRQERRIELWAMAEQAVERSQVSRLNDTAIIAAIHLEIGRAHV